jgi:hypothetical protein
MKIQSKEIVLVPISDIKLNPKNRNRHSPEQIARLVKIFEYQGFRQPLTISNQSGLCVAGEGRYLAAKKLKAKELPCIFQDFDSPDQETAHGIADNAIQGQWMDLDFGSISADLGDLGPDFDPEWLGMKDFTIDVADKAPEPTADTPGTYKEQFGVIVMCVSELNQEEVFYKLTNMGHECRVVVT